MTDRDLHGRVVLVTGGGGGLGQALCSTLAEAGATVVAGDVRLDKADEAAEAVAAAGGRALAVRLDVTDDTSVREALALALESFGTLDTVINNAGIDVTLPMSDLSLCEWDRILSVNLRGPFLLSKAALPSLIESGSGHIVNIVSTAAKRSWPNASAYHASKWGLLGLSHALHAELRAFGVKVTAVVAGGMRTPFLLDRFPGLDVETLQDPHSVAETVRFVLTQPEGTVIPEVMVLPMRETSWP